METSPNLIYYAIPGFILLMILEVYLSHRMRKDAYEIKDSASSIGLGLGNVAVGLLAKVILLGVLTFFFQFRMFEIPVTWWSWILLVFLDDFSYYWMHRVSHRNRFFWASHIVHHSSKRYNLSTALRQTWTGPFYTFIFWLWLPLLGFHPYMVMAQMSISLIYQFWIHTETVGKLPNWYEAFFNTPSHHRVHHATNPRYLDRNHAGIFIIWDKIFETFEAEVEDEPAVYGLIKNIDSFNPVRIAFNEWKLMFNDAVKRGLTIRERWNYLTQPPGWKHDGTGILSEDLRSEWEEHNSTVHSNSK
jgi:sterol desaturase/sphingolipid hydroxylase (fatty acid hydroxylase superfamily)